MRLVTIRPRVGSAVAASDERVGILLESGQIVTIGALAEIARGNLPGEFGRLSLVALLEMDPGFGAIRRALELASATAIEAAASIDSGSVDLAAPIPRPGKIVGVGYNYLEHVREQGLARPARPVLFSMFANAVVGDGAPVRKPAGTHALDLEAELAVVIGKRASGVPTARALEYVAGYMAANDVTARDWQGQAKALRPDEQGDGQWLRAKGADTFLPLGPCLVTADELGDGRGLAVRSWLTRAADRGAGHGTAAVGANSAAQADPADRLDAGLPFRMQDGNTADLMFGVAELIATISAEVTLDPGDVIVSGTPSGVGVFREPPVFLEPGDLVRVEVARIGSLTSPITDEDGKAPEGSAAARFLASVAQV
jgi:2-keto-4-pentenoate hydratase/2-oxohepta-3-ene-1,7-dioic acid hydratase in catechol pathway